MNASINVASNQLTHDLIFKVRGFDALITAIDEYMKASLHTINEGGFYTHGTVEVSMIYNSTDGVIHFCHDNEKLVLESIQHSMAFLLSGKSKFFKSFNRHYVDDSYLEDVIHELINVLINEHIAYEDGDIEMSSSD